MNFDYTTNIKIFFKFPRKLDTACDSGSTWQGKNIHIYRNGLDVWSSLQNKNSVEVQNFWSEISSRFSSRLWWTFWVWPVVMQNMYSNIQYNWFLGGSENFEQFGMGIQEEKSFPAFLAMFTTVLYWPVFSVQNMAKWSVTLTFCGVNDFSCADIYSNASTIPNL